MNNRNLLFLPYQLTRRPLALVDSQVARRLPREFRLRVLFDRALGSFDQAAGRLLQDRAIVQQGTDRVTRSVKLESASLLEQQAADLRDAGTDAARQGERLAAEKSDQAQDQALGGVKAAQSAEVDGKQAAGVRARTRATQAKQQADARAEQRLTTAEQSRKQAETAASTRAAEAKKDAKSKLTGAAQQRGSAASTRRDADQLGELATAKRHERTTS